MFGPTLVTVLLAICFFYFFSAGGLPAILPLLGARGYLPQTCAELHLNFMGKKAAVIGPKSPKGPKGASKTSSEEGKAKRFPQYGADIQTAMDVAEVSISKCSEASGLGRTLLIDARAGRHIGYTKHLRLIKFLKLHLKAHQLNLADIEYPWEDAAKPAVIAPKPEEPHLVRATLKFPDVVMKEKQNIPQGATGLDLPLEGGQLEKVECSIETASPYFRFGVKLYPIGGMLIGDTTVQTREDVVLHIGRNASDRPGVTSRADLFVTHYRMGPKAGTDKRAFEVPENLKVKIQVDVDSGSMASLRIDGHRYDQVPVDPKLCRKVGLIAWNDYESPMNLRVTRILAVVWKTVH